MSDKSALGAAGAILGVAIPTTRIQECYGLVASLVDVPRNHDVAIAVAFQGRRTDFLTLQANLSAFGEHNVRVVHDPGRGASRCRNVAIGALPNCEWIWSPNDNSRIEQESFRALVHILPEVAPDVGAIVMGYVSPSGARRTLDNGEELDGWSLWQALEAATVWRRTAISNRLGPFDESIGTGSFGWAQSGEGTDLLVEVNKRSRVIGSDLTVSGEAMDLRNSRSKRLVKRFYYAVGFGVVCRRHFGFRQTAVSIFGPVLSWCVGRRREGERVAFGVSLIETCGRALGYVLGDSAGRIRRIGGW